jgi:hypothetical protein
MRMNHGRLQVCKLGRKFDFSECRVFQLGYPSLFKAVNCPCPLSLKTLSIEKILRRWQEGIYKERMEEKRKYPNERFMYSSEI